MESDAGLPIAELRVDGGATVNDLMMQFQSDILPVKVLRPEIIETTALGAAYLAGLAVGFWESIDAISSQWRVSGSFVPQKNDEWRKTQLGLWHKAVKSVLHWTRES